MQSPESNTNTILLTLLALAVIGFGTWYVMNEAVEDNEAEDTANIRIEVPSSNN